MHYNDPQLLEELSNGNEQAFKQLFVTYYSPLCEFATQYVSDKDAEEIVQDLMMHLWEKREFLVITGSVKSYLFTAVRNRCLNANSTQQIQTSHAQLYLRKTKGYLSESGLLYVGGTVPAYRESNQGAARKLSGSILDESFRDYTNKEIAERLGVSIKTVEYRITQAENSTGKLKDYLYLLSVWL